MKKLFAMIMAVAMVLSMSVTAFAAEVPTYEDITVSGTVVQGDSDYINVTLTWEDMAFEYTVDEYDPSTGEIIDYWSDYNSIQIVNDSTMGLTFDFAFSADVSWSGSLKFWNFNTEEEDAQTNSYSVDVEAANIVDGENTTEDTLILVKVTDDSAGIEANATLGTMSVTISKTETATE